MQALQEWLAAREDPPAEAPEAEGALADPALQARACKPYTLQACRDWGKSHRRAVPRPTQGPGLPGCSHARPHRAGLHTRRQACQLPVTMTALSGPWSQNPRPGGGMGRRKPHRWTHHYQTGAAPAASSDPAGSPQALAGCLDQQRTGAVSMHSPTPLCHARPKKPKNLKFQKP